MDNIFIRGAKEHNLQNIDVSIPRMSLTVVTGVSGSGKSSLVFDTVYAEGQRRYVESLSAYARQFLELMPKPDVDSIEGLSPAISIEQKTISRNPRSTVGTITEIYDYLRLLYARVGTPYSPMTGLPIESQSVSEIVALMAKTSIGSKLYVLSPIVQGRKGEYRKELQNLQKQGFLEVIIDGKMTSIEEAPLLEKNKNHTIEVVTDRVVMAEGLETRLAHAVEAAISLSGGLVYLQDIETGKRIVFSSLFACPVSGFSIDKIEPRLFSFNSPFGACASCDGLGVRLIFDPELIVQMDKNLRNGAIPFEILGFYHYNVVFKILKSYDIADTTPFRILPQHVQDLVLYGSSRAVKKGVGSSYEGVMPYLRRKFFEIEDEKKLSRLSKYQRTLPCDDCKSFRLNGKALAVKIGGKHIGEVTHMSIKDAAKWFGGLMETLKPQAQMIAKKVMKEIVDRLQFLIDVGLEYLTLSRSSSTLSGGESQRIYLASQLGSKLTGVMYVLDEPSIGLHQRDNARLLETIKGLRDYGNTVIVVEHDEEFMLNADHIIDMGPGAGVHGGNVVAEGKIDSILNCPGSITGNYLSGKRVIPIPKERRPVGSETKFLSVKNASVNNLKNIDVFFPIGVMTCVSGVSGCGKSSLVIEELYKRVYEHFSCAAKERGANSFIEGLEFIDKVIDIDQAPIGRTPRSNPATYIGVFDSIRGWFATLPESKARGYSPGRFSFNVPGGRCESCKGDGVIKIEMHFLPNVYVPCDQCKGRRYNRETLGVLYQGSSIADILDMTIEESLGFFKPLANIYNRLKVLSMVGLGYMSLGQRATTLSGGEAQRVKLAKELLKRSTGKTLYILDEPTTGLSFADIHKLLDVLHALVNQGNTVVIIEHNLDVIKTADWVIDLGPEGGENGGKIIACGTPEDIARAKSSHTGQYLMKMFEKSRVK